MPENMCRSNAPVTQTSTLCVNRVARTRNVQPWVIVLLDFNSPFTRDAAKLSKIMEMVKSCLDRNSMKSAAMIWLPDHAKEASTIHDEVTSIAVAMKHAKLESNLDIICNTRTHIVLCTQRKFN
jgi:predicted component of type VI protein secretion system